MPNERLVVAMTGASGAPYAMRLFAHLVRLGVPFDFLISPAAAAVLRQEVDARREWIKDGRADLSAFGLEHADVRTFRLDDYNASCASGTALSRGMLILPCSGGTMGRIASGASTNLIERAADVCLKERRRLVICPRETPISLIHLRNMTTLTEAGAIILPASPGFYHAPRTIDDLLDHVVAKALDALAIPHAIIRRWGDPA